MISVQMCKPGTEPYRCWSSRRALKFRPDRWILASQSSPEHKTLGGIPGDMLTRILNLSRCWRTTTTSTAAIGTVLPDDAVNTTHMHLKVLQLEPRWRVAQAA